MRVHGPRFSRPPDKRFPPTGDTCHALALLAAKREPVELVEPLHTFVIDGPNLSAQQHMQPPIAPTWSLRRQGSQSLAHLELVAAHPPLVAHGPALRPDDPAGAPLRHFVGPLQMAHRCPSSSGRHQFFVAMSFKAVLSSVRSATICLSRRFSSSRWRSRRS